MLIKIFIYTIYKMSLVNCQKCNHLSEYPLCRVCKDKYNEYRKKLRESKRLEKLNDETICFAINFGNNKCKNIKSVNNYCYLHQYLLDYNEEIMNKLEKCSRCTKMHYPTINKTCPSCLNSKHEYDMKSIEIKEIEIDENLKKCSGCRKMCQLNEYKTCTDCRNRIQIKQEHIKCKKDECAFKKSVDNDYCGKHQKEYFKECVELEGLKVCYNYIRGCIEKLDSDYKYIKCRKCLDKDNENEHKRKMNKTIEINDNEKICSTCTKVYELIYFEGINGETKTCENCREQNKKADEKRDKNHVNELKRISEQNQDRKIVKTEWKYNNPDKVIKYWMDARSKKMDTMGLEEYHRIEAENAKKWRDSNPDKIQYNYEKDCENIDRYYIIYKKSSFLKNLTFELSQEEFNEIVTKNCYYCGIIQNKGFNGIDKKNCNIGYVIDNCVSCCEMCNIMKGCLDSNVFIKRMEHILTNHEYIEGEVNYKLFGEYYCMSYSKYKLRAINKLKMDFELTIEEYDNIINDICYICGKENNINHQNGIDRIDNSIGYIIDNVETCCGECNFMKNNYNFIDFLNKCFMIYENTKDYNIEFDIENCNIKYITKHLNKKTKEELQIIKKNKKIETDKKLLDSYKSENIQNRIDSVLELRKRKEEMKTIDKSIIKVKDVVVEDVVIEDIVIEDIVESLGTQLYNKIMTEKRIRFEEKNKLTEQEIYEKYKKHIVKVKKTDEEKREYQRLQKQKQRSKNKLLNGEEPIIRVKKTDEEKREYQRLQKQKQRAKNK